MVLRGRARLVARLSCAAAASLALASPVFAQQQSDPAPLDPNAPLDPMPDLGVDWPDMDEKEPLATPPAQSVIETPAEANLGMADSSAEQHYSVVLTGLEAAGDPTALVAAFEKQSVLKGDRKQRANAAQIDRRSRADAELLAELLRAQGYYDALVVPAIERSGDALLVRLEAEPGQQYSFESVELPGLDQAGAEAASLRQAFAVKRGDPVVAQDVLAAGIALKVALGQQGFALAKVGEQDIEIDHETHRASLVLPVDPGPVARFGNIRVTGRPPFSPRHVQTIARFKRGDMFKRSKVDDLRRALVATGLISSAEVQVVPEGDGRTVDLAVHLEPAPMRTIAGELGYGTGEGIRAEASWQHRNFFNPEGALTLRGLIGTKEQLAAVQFRRNNFLRRDQVFTLQTSVSHIDFEAYEAKTVQISGFIERQSNIIWHKKWTWSYGGELVATDERGAFDASGIKETHTFLIAALPVTLGYDGSDDLLDPTRGFRLQGRVSPEISAKGGEFSYGRVQLDASAYHPVSSGVVAAGRVRFGTILNAEALSIAPSRRFYSGGGGSVRGYGYQQLGPKDMDGDPIGGRGLAEFSLEARVRLKAFGGNFGIVPFLDGGTLTEKQFPGTRHWQFGAGLGVRYYSSFGPIRLDVGTPLNPRQDDGRVAVVVSLGQAF
jgi:translocation and assembly module TamA